MEYLSAKNDIEANRRKKELDIIGIRYHENIAARCLHFFHVENKRADSAAAEKGDFIQIENNMRAALFHHLMNLGIEDAGIIPADFALHDEEGNL